MIISIRYFSKDAEWAWEVYTIGKERSYANGMYSSGTAKTWKEMMSMLEISITELEKRDETRIPRK